MAARADMTMDQGANFETVVTVTDSSGDKIDLTNYETAGQIRKHHTCLLYTSPSPRDRG